MNRPKCWKSENGGPDENQVTKLVECWGTVHCRTVASRLIIQSGGAYQLTGGTREKSPPQAAKKNNLWRHAFDSFHCSGEDAGKPSEAGGVWTITFFEKYKVIKREEAAGGFWKTMRSLCVRIGSGSGLQIEQPSMRIIRMPFTSFRQSVWGEARSNLSVYEIILYTNLLSQLSGRFWISRQTCISGNSIDFK